MSEAHEELGFWRKYVFSTDHKTIGIQYGLTALVFLFFGFCLMMMMRWQLAYPGQPIPLIGALLPERLVDQGAMLPDFPFKPATYFDFSPLLCVGAVGFAVGCSLLGAWFPASRAARFDPAAALGSA